ncbi:MAG: hypothetical protein U9P36_15460 [Thermodesulfobacteriota bacterium]|nr:hypothetical protein [Thermodesulfobacteriota bacterium]
MKLASRFSGHTVTLSAARCFLVAACSGLLLLQGCAPLILAVGAGAGYLVADKKAARKVDRFFKDLWKTSSTSARRISGTRKTKKKYKYKQGSEPTVRLQETSLRPSTVARGESITVVVIYGVMGGPSGGLIVTEKKELWFNTKRLTVLQDESVTRENGTWKSRLVFKVPESADKGTYTVKQSIVFKGKKSKSEKKFKLL